MTINIPMRQLTINIITFLANGVGKCKFDNGVQMLKYNTNLCIFFQLANLPEIRKFLAKYSGEFENSLQNRRFNFFWKNLSNLSARCLARRKILSNYIAEIGHTFQTGLGCTLYSDNPAESSVLWKNAHACL